jgi:hypothetical protein
MNYQPSAMWDSFGNGGWYAVICEPYVRYIWKGRKHAMWHDAKKEADQEFKQRYSKAAQ